MKSRRDFVKKVGLGTMAMSVGASSIFTTKSYAKVIGANDRVRVALVGVRSRMKALADACGKLKNVEVAYSCDVDDNILAAHAKWCETTLGYIPKVEKDFRKLVEIKDIDAVIIATPEHWHAPMAIWSMEAGKHVYVEKPCSHNAREGELLVKAQRKYKKVCQMGNQQRSAATSILAIKEIGEGIIGEPFKAKAYYSSSRKSIGKGNRVAVPSHLDWELFQGPAPREAYRDNIHPYNWHWFRTWGTGEIHNNGTHEIDVCRWALGVDYPTQVVSFGSKSMYKDDDWQFVDTQDVTYKFDGGKYISWEGHSRNKHGYNPGRGATIWGSKGSIRLDRNFYELYDLSGKRIKRINEKEQSGTTDTVGGGGLTVQHMRNFIQTIRGLDTLNSEIGNAAISTHLCHLGTIAQRLERPITVNPKTGKVPRKDKEANKLWGREYEPGWEPKVS
ncbi:dehydrogenase (plasmid) [Fulvitalea axinellae]|uniref:Dehydrogenase n=1 Tax=Fulvitalea axinellae TaxID=1182444 RepID=A0AAU9CIJ8_9BACT|nr:dehydrogenase [Fulvitalea axinellae]